MPSDPPLQNVLDGVATREQLFQLCKRTDMKTKLRPASDVARAFVNVHRKCRLLSGYLIHIARRNRGSASCSVFISRDLLCNSF
ncbi:hypothetical protein CN311_23265 [Mesorhizobium sanjuanii]|uniref:Uncharacterized protein n=1 Tax=Mesorhizobium sanjuanii TaxID=2037900 RepID=A0A2A6FB81_9HYPH|nr:hypothetical protein CN311_23265 [Mesorhizobium sanjuanii]QKD19745.1 hypothetical protein HGP13_35250 [Mesorhizobium sp. NZP2077]